MKATTLLVGLLAVQISVLNADRFESIPLADGSPSGYRLILPGTPAALAAQQEQFLPSQKNEFTVPKFTLTATRIFTEHGSDLSQFSDVHSHLPNSQPPQFLTKLVMPVKHQPQEFVHSTFVNPTVSTKNFNTAPVETKFQVSRTPSSNLVTKPGSITPVTHSINVAPVHTIFTQSLTPASNQITHSVSQTPSLKFQTVQVPTTKITPTLPQTTQSFIHSRNNQIKMLQPTVKTTPSILILHNFDNSQILPETKIEARKPINIFNRGPSAKFENQVSGETFLDFRGFRGEEASPSNTFSAPVITSTSTPFVTSTFAPATSTSAPVITETTSKPERVRVTITKRVRGPARKVVSKVTKVQPRKQVEVSPNLMANLVKESAVPVRPLVITEVPVTRGPFRFASTTESPRFAVQVKSKETESEEFTRQAQEASYSFTSDVSDPLSDSSVMRQESRKDGAVEGSYSYSDGFFRRTVHYKADHLGYRVLKEEVEPLGDGPNPDPEGRAEVALQTSSGVHSKYSVTSSDIRSTQGEE